MQPVNTRLPDGFLNATAPIQAASAEAVGLVSDGLHAGNRSNNSHFQHARPPACVPLAADASVAHERNRFSIADQTAPQFAPVRNAEPVATTMPDASLFLDEGLLKEHPEPGASLGACTTTWSIGPSRRPLRPDKL